MYPVRESVSQVSALKQQLNKDTRVNLASARLFNAADYLQVRCCVNKTSAPAISALEPAVMPLLKRRRQAEGLLDSA